MPITPPTKFQAIWANDESASFVTQPIPTTSQPGVRASLNDGFPQITFASPNAPDGRDFNGILYMLTAASQFQQAGGVYAWDSVFSAAVGGYPSGAVVANASTVGFFWINSSGTNNTTNPDAGGAGWTAFQVANQPMTGAQLQFTTGAVLTLAPKSGGWLWVNGFNYSVAGSPTLSNASTPLANTLYYVYAVISGGVVALTASTTGYTVLTNGIAVNSVDPTQTVVGMTRTNASSQFQGTLLTRSYWQRPRTAVSETSFASDQTTASATYVEVGGSSAIRNSFLVWAGENVDWSLSGGFNSSTSGTSAFTGVGFDSTTTPEKQVSVAGGPAGTVYFGSIGLRGIKTGLSEGVHFATLLGKSGGGTATWFGGASSGDVLDIVING